jgi:transcriptional regulator with XRE-family HTH domain
MLHKKLRNLRQSKGMTLQQVAEQLAVTRASVSKWECGKSRPDMSRIQAMAELFGVSSQYLLGLSTSPTLKDFPVIELKFGVSLDSLLDYYSNLERFPSNLPVSDSAFFVRLNDETLSDLGPNNVAPGSLLLVDPTQEAQNGDIVLVARPNGAMLFMRLSIVGDVNMFSFVNHKYALKNNPVTDLNILGVAMQSVLVTGLRDLFWRPIVA